MWDVRLTTLVDEGVITLGDYALDVIYNLCASCSSPTIIEPTKL